MSAISVKSGDTIVETIFAVAIFAALSVMAIHTMNNGLQQAQRALETTMARNAIDSQAEALRFIHNAYIAERELGTDQQQFSDIWNKIKDLATNDAIADVNSANSCADLYGKNPAGVKEVVNGQEKAFILNPRFLMPTSARSGTGSTIVVAGETTIFDPPAVHPRIVYNNTTDTLNSDVSYGILNVEGLWVIAAKSAAVESHGPTNINQYYDFYIQTCWQSLSSQAPATLTTIVRLYNPEIVK